MSLLLEGRSGRPGRVGPSRCRGRGSEDRARRMRASGRASSCVVDRAAGPRTRPTDPRGGRIHESVTERQRSFDERVSRAGSRPRPSAEPSPADDHTRGLEGGGPVNRGPWPPRGRLSFCRPRPSERSSPPWSSPPARGAGPRPAPPQGPDEHVGESEQRETEQEIRVPERDLVEEAAEGGVVHRVRDERVRVGPAARPARTRRAPSAPRCTTS